MKKKERLQGWLQGQSMCFASMRTRLWIPETHFKKNAACNLKTLDMKIENPHTKVDNYASQNLHSEFSETLPQ